MGKKKTILVICGGILAIALIVAGIVSAIGPMNESTVRYETADGDSRELLQGAVKPKSLEAGGYALATSDYSFELYAVDEGYATRIVDMDGEVVMEQCAPIAIQIKKEAEANDYLGNNSETELFFDYYDELQVQENSVLAIAVVESAGGSQFYVSDQYVVCEDERSFILDRDIKVLATGKSEEGFNSFVKFKEQEAKTSENYEYLMPALVVKNGENLAPTAIGADMSLDYVWARDSHMGLPMVMTRNIESGNTFSLTHLVENADTGIDESDGSWIVSKNLSYASLGISNVDGYVSMDVCYPGMEGDINYQGSAPGMVRRSHPIRNDVVHNYRVAFEAQNYDNFNDAMVESYQNAFERMPIPEVDVDVEKVYDATLDLFDEYTQEYAEGNMGMPFSIYLDGEVASSDYVMGFVGQQTSLGFHLIRNGLETDSKEELQKGRAVVDFWVNESFTKYGFPNVWYGASSDTWAEADTIPAYFRFMCDGMEGILDAYMEDKQAGNEHSKWLQRCIGYADWLVEVQRADGSYCRAYNQETGKPYEINDGKDWTGGNNTSCAVRFLVRMYEQTGKQTYLDAATKAATYVYDTDYSGGQYFGGAPDRNNTVDKEAAVMALYAFDCMYEQTEDEKWLKAAEHAATQVASFVYTFDFNVWGDSTYNIYRDLVGTSGLSIIGTGNNSTDTFSSYLYYEFFKLYVYTGKEFYYDFARLTQNNARQFVCIDGSLPYGADGLVCEAQTIAGQFYASSVDCQLLWCSIGMVDPTASMEDAFGVATVEEAREMSMEALTESLKAYGSGGKHR